MQMWEFMGRLMLDNNLLTQMQPLGRDDEGVFNAINRDGGYHMSRAEICEMSGLLSQGVFVNRARDLGVALRNALGTPPQGVDYSKDAAFRDLREVMGVLCIDTKIRDDVRAKGTAAEVKTVLEGYNFSLTPEHAAIVHTVLGGGGTGIQHADVIHACWSPPDCLSAVSFAPSFQRPRRGGTIRETIVRDHGHGGTQAV